MAAQDEGEVKGKWNCPEGDYTFHGKRNSFNYEITFCPNHKETVLNFTPDEIEKEEIDTTNDQLVSMIGTDGKLEILVPKRSMTPEEAIRHAAWLVILAGETDLEQFNKVFKACLNT